MDEVNNLQQYVSFSSFVQPSFWSKLAELKIDIDRLNDNARKTWGYFSTVQSTCNKLIVEVDSASFNQNFDHQNKYVPFHGKIYNTNTVEQFKDCNKVDKINEEGKLFMDQLKAGEVLNDPSLLNFFIILSFSDLKTYKFYYWFAFPVIKNFPIINNGIKNISLTFTREELHRIAEKYEKLDAGQKAYFLIHKTEHETKIYEMREKLKELNENNFEEYYFAYSDPNYELIYPGCHLKNYAIFLLHYCPFLANKPINFLAFSLHLESSRLECTKSAIFNLILPDLQQHENEWVGWEKNERGQFGPKLSNMKNIIDPQNLAEDMVDLNLKLMKWRILPDINLEKIKNTKCLLLGAGTLGCSVARTLLGWGVRYISFVDNSTVSYTNPVRQTLFNFEDSVASKPKAVAAAENLKKIFPGVNTESHQFTIPMPGHSVSDTTVETVKENVEKLEKLIQENDIIFLLMDSRESRWLPTLLASYHNKLVINVALGFDTYLIMRHGIKNASSENPIEIEGFKSIVGNQLGCYFCNDVTAPGNSIKDRTLDQQCTVTRPGVSAIAGGLAVELAISLTQSIEGPNTPAFYKTKSDTDNVLDNQCILGILPHSIRGFLSIFTQVLPATQKYLRCTACSDKVLNEYEKRHFEFLSDVFNSSKYLEDLTGLTELYEETNLIDVLEMSDDESA